MSSDINTKSKLKVFALIGIGLIGMAFGLAKLGESAEDNSVKQINTAFKGLEAKYQFLYEHFGKLPHFYDALSRSIIKDGYSMLELLTIGDKAVVDESKVDYASLSLPELPDVIHLHPTIYDAHTAITVGGYPVTDISQNTDGELVMSLENVGASTVMALEQTIDNSAFSSTGDDYGRLTYKKSSAGYEVQLRGTQKFSK